MKRWFSFFMLIIVVGISFFLSENRFYVMADNEILLERSLTDKKEFSVQFIHSVQKTPVRENFVIDGKQKVFILKSTQYQSFGVGLPFLEGEGKFSQKDGYFFFEEMDRKFQALSLRTGLGTKLTFIIEGKEYPFYENLPLGQKIDIIIASRWQCLNREVKEAFYGEKS